MSSRQIDNSHFGAKVAMRLNLVKDGMKILDCFHGNGELWGYIGKQIKISVTGIEKQKGKGKGVLYGECEKIIPSLDLSRYDIIDLDAYGIPDDALIKVLDGSPKSGTIIFYTFILVGMARCTNYLLNNIGISTSMAAKCPTLFSNFAFDSYLDMLYNYNIKEVYDLHYQEKNSHKHYGYFIIP
jgi:hypothetical protein